MAGVQRTPSRGTPHTPTVSPQNAALIGASAAFRRPQVQHRVSDVNGLLAANGASRAAVTADQRSKTPSPSRSQKDTHDAESLVGRAVGAIATSAPRAQLHRTASSQTAASIAASRASPVSVRERATAAVNKDQAQMRQPAKKPPIAPKPRPLSSHQRALSSSDPIPQPDTTPILSTTSLVDLFERRSTKSTSRKPQLEPLVIKPTQSLSIHSPKPLRSSDGIASVFAVQLESGHQTQASPSTRLVQRAFEAQQENAGKGGNDTRQEQTHTRGEDNKDDGGDKRHATRPIQARGIAKAVKRDDLSPEELYFSASEDTASSPPSGFGGRMASMSPTAMQYATDSAQPRLVSRHPQTNSKPIEIPSSSRRTVSTSGGAPPQSLPRSITATYNQMYPRKMTPLTTGEDLANALVASSLASSRGPSPRKLEPPPVLPRRHNHGHGILSLHSRTPSPPKKGMRHTMRKEESTSSDSDDEYHPYGKHKKKRRVRKHPNKHHEGDRKRWREAVTERERRRYEGVWAANKGLYCTFTQEEEQALGRSPDAGNTLEAQALVSEQISNIVAHDIWSRSRLSDETLEAVWDMVDSKCVGRLSKEEFVVGMWLIDQRLKGRKLPVKVSASVWSSVNTLHGIKVKKR